MVFMGSSFDDRERKHSHRNSKSNIAMSSGGKRSSNSSANKRGNKDEQLNPFDLSIKLRQI